MTKTYIGILLLVAVFLTACLAFFPRQAEPDHVPDRWREQMPPDPMIDRGGSGMQHRMRRGWSWATPVVTPAPIVTPSSSLTVSYRVDIQSIFDRHCINCHGGQAGLFLDTYDYAMRGGASGVVIIPGEPDRSKLLLRIQGIGGARMPLGENKLQPSEIEAIYNWIKAGSPNN
jgi:mono/diheme cytochrome c family protein